MRQPKPIRPLDERRSLNDRQTAFIGFYLIDFNATQAAIKAGYSSNGASQKGSTLLANDKIKAEIDRRKAALRARSEVSRDWLVHELADEFRAAREPAVRLATDGKTVISTTRKPQAVARIGELLARLHGWVDDKPSQPIQQLVNFVIQR